MIPIFDSGHAGLINGFYETPGKRSPNWECGIFYEGMGNRWAVNRLIELCDRAGIPYYHVSPELYDVSLQERVKRANDIYAVNKNVYFLSIHHNAGGGHGIEGFTSIGETTSDKIAEVFLQNFKADFAHDTTLRTDVSDGDLDKESNFFVLRNTLCPSVLLELEFMDSKSGYLNCWSETVMALKVESMFKSIVKVYNEL